MKLLYLLVADAANESGGKANALGIGVRLILPNSLPSVTPMAVLAGAEATDGDVGDQPLRITLENPAGRRLPLLNDTVPVAPRLPEDAELPIEVRVSVSFPFLAEAEGIYTLRLQLGGARSAYRMLVRRRQEEEA